LTKDGRVSIAGRTLIITENGSRAEQHLTGDDALLAAYREHFGIILDTVPQVIRAPSVAAPAAVPPGSPPAAPSFAAPPAAPVRPVLAEPPSGAGAGPSPLSGPSPVVSPGARESGLPDSVVVRETDAGRVELL
jgi:hypothetical protein